MKIRADVTAATVGVVYLLRRLGRHSGLSSVRLPPSASIRSTSAMSPVLPRIAVLRIASSRASSGFA